MIFNAFALMTLLSLESAADAPLLEILRDAQASSLSKTRSGTLKAYVRENHQAKGILESEIAVDWTDDNMFMTARIGNPDGIDGRDYIVTLDKAKETIYSIERKMLYAYNPYANQLHVHKSLDRLKELDSQSFLEVLPKSNWYRCCPPRTTWGREWLEYLERSLIESNGSSFQLERGQGDLITFIRTDPGSGEFEIHFSLGSGGFPVHYEYRSKDPKFPSMRGNLTWKEHTPGVFVLASRAHEEIDPSNPGVFIQKYLLEIHSVKLGPIPKSIFTLNHIKQSIPRNFQLYDHTSRHPSRPEKAKSVESNLKGLAEAVRSGVFFKKDSR